MAEVAVDRWRWTVEGYETAAAAGVFGPEARVELIDGEVYQVAAMLPGHASTVGRISDLLSARIERSRWVVRTQLPVHLYDDSEPEPDVWVARGPADRYDHRHPGAADLVLVVEVSDTTLAFDRDVKIPRYARAGVPEAWLVSLPERAVHRYADPLDGAYRSVEILDHGRLRVAGTEVEVAAVLPGP
jgi:Uma2 family endonuclease